MKRFRAAPVLGHPTSALRPYHPSRTLGNITVAIICVVIHCCVLVDLARGQEPAAPSFYPLAVGDYWVYLDFSMMLIPDTVTVEAYGDTLIEGQQWIKLHRWSHRYENHDYYLERIDTTGDVLGRYAGISFLRYRLSDTSATFWMTGADTARFASCVAGEYIGAIGHILYVHYWRPGDTAATEMNALGEGVGFLYRGPYNVIIDGDTERLAGALIDGKGYGIVPSRPRVDSASLAYYPLHVGDRWIYEVTSTFWGNLGSITVDVVGDTTLSNGLRYFVLTRNSGEVSNLFFERIDSSTTVVYHMDTFTYLDLPYDSLAAMPGDTVHVLRPTALLITCDSLAADSILEMSTTVKYFGAPFASNNPRYGLAAGLGVVRRWHTIRDPNQPGDGTYSEDLVYARIDGREYGTPVSVEPVRSVVPFAFSLGQNYPNPFNPSTTIRYGLPSRSHVTLTVFNTLGQQVAILVQGEQEAGFHEAVFDASVLASGVYVYRLQSGETILSRKMVLVH